MDMGMTAENVEELRRVHDKAKAKGETQFYWSGHMWLTLYVGYLLEYLEGKL